MNTMIYLIISKLNVNCWNSILGVVWSHVGGGACSLSFRFRLVSFFGCLLLKLHRRLLVGLQLTILW